MATFSALKRRGSRAALRRASLEVPPRGSVGHSQDPVTIGLSSAAPPGMQVRPSATWRAADGSNVASRRAGYPASESTVLPSESFSSAHVSGRGMGPARAEWCRHTIIRQGDERLRRHRLVRSILACSSRSPGSRLSRQSPRRAPTRTSATRGARNLGSGHQRLRRRPAPDPRRGMGGLRGQHGHRR